MMERILIKIIQQESFSQLSARKGWDVTNRLTTKTPEHPSILYSLVLHSFLLCTLGVEDGERLETNVLIQNMDEESNLKNMTRILLNIDSGDCNNIYFVISRALL
jgi:hypothetical protein